MINSWANNPTHQQKDANFNVQGVGKSSIEPKRTLSSQRTKENKTAGPMSASQNAKPQGETMKVNTSVQCGTQIEDLDQPEFLISEMAGSEARMSVSIQVT